MTTNYIYVKQNFIKISLVKTDIKGRGELHIIQNL